MSLHTDPRMLWLFGGVLALLFLASLIGALLARRPGSESSRAVVDNLNARIRAWWIMCAVFAVALATGGLGSIVLFGLTSFVAFREFVTMSPTKRGDHRALFWAFFVFIPAQYYLVAVDWYGLFSILIPIYAFLFLPTRTAMSGETEHFLERTAKVQWGLMVSVYCVSHAPALLTLDIPGFEGRGAMLLFYLVLVAQISDVLQYVFGKTLGRHKIAPLVSPNKTWEGFLGGVASASLIGAGLWWATPFTPLQSAGMAFAITLLGFCGGLVMSAIKRDRGIKDFGTMIEGHGGILDRIDSICFAAPVFFHLTRYFFT